jgi:hypothetical protein
MLFTKYAKAKIIYNGQHGAYLLMYRQSCHLILNITEQISLKFQWYMLCATYTKLFKKLKRIKDDNYCKT